MVSSFSVAGDWLNGLFGAPLHPKWLYGSQMNKAIVDELK
jgi:hypothetical protein